MKIPIKLIDTTIDEFTAEGYTCTTAATNEESRFLRGNLIRFR